MKPAALVQAGAAVPSVSDGISVDAWTLPVVQFDPLIMMFPAARNSADGALLMNATSCSTIQRPFA